jgi:PAS domain S-box-containing protein
MKAKNNREKFFPFRLSEISGILTAGLGLISLLGWIIGFLTLASFGSEFIPMAPSTALLFVLFGTSILLRVHLPSQQIIHRINILCGLICGLIALLLFYSSYNGIYLNAEHPGISISGKIGKVPIGHMSPLTAFNFLLASLSFLTSIQSSLKFRLFLIAFGSAGSVILISFILLLAYLLGTPLLYSGNIIPPALSTALAFMALGVALLSFAGLQFSTQNQSVEPKSTQASYTLIIVFALLASGIVTIGYNYYRNYEKQFRAEVEKQLSAITDLKVNELKQWRKERMGDANVFYKNVNFSSLVKQYLTNQNRRDAEEKLKIWMRQVREAYMYDRVCLHDINGFEKFSFPEEKIYTPKMFSVRSKEAVNSGKIIFEDFYIDESDNKIYISILIPILDDQNQKRILGILALRIDPEHYLYPLINRWPTVSRTAETLLIRKEDNEVVFLNALRFNKTAALKLRLRITENSNLPAVRAALGEEGIVEGNDYRGFPVIAVTRAVPNSPWYLVARMDADEVYQPLAERIWFLAILIGSLIIGAGAGTGLIWRQQHLLFYREKYKSSEQIRKLNRVYAVLSDINQAIVRIREPKNLFDAACKIAVDNGGFKMTWIGRLNKETNKVEVAASAGVSEDYLAKINIDMSDPVRMQGPTGIAIKSGRYMISNDIENDESMLPWKEVASNLGFNSSAAFPLKVFGEVWGTFNLYSGEKEFFDKEEIKLLDELSMDISFSIEFLQQEAERKHAEKALYESEQKLRNIIENSTNVFYSHTTDHILTYLSPQIENLLGYTPEEALVNWTELASDNPINEEGYNLTVKAIETGLPQPPYELELVHKNGKKVWVEVREAPVVENGKTISIVGALVDITDRKIAEQEIRKLNAELEERVLRRTAQLEAANKELEAFSYSVSHDLRAPLRAIDGFSKILLEEYSSNLDFNGKRMLDLVRLSAQNMAKLIDDLLVFSRTSRTQISLTKINMHDLFASVISEIESPSLNIDFKLNPIPEVNGDPNLIKQVIVNLMNNAVKFSRTREMPIVEIGSFIERNEAVFYVKDNGVGFDMKYADKLFGVFQRLHSAQEFEGTGVGLAIVQRIIHKHGGRVWAESKPDEGAVFCFSLPVAIDEGKIKTLL